MGFKKYNTIRQIIFGFLFILFQNSAQGQVEILEDPSITRIMDQYIQDNKAISHITGWRISVITTTDRRLMEQTRIKFKEQFSSLKTKWEYKEPYYYLKAGAFLTRVEALSFFEQVKEKFPTAFLSIDKLTYDEL